MNTPFNNRWLGSIHNNNDWINKSRKNGRELIMASIFPIMLGLFLYYLLDILFVILISAAMCAGMIILGVHMLTVKTYGIGLGFIIEEEQKKHWIDDGNLERSIKRLLQDSQIPYSEAKRLGCVMSYSLPENLFIEVICRGSSKGTGKLFLVEYGLNIDIVNISLGNSNYARNIQCVLDKIQIKDKYPNDEENEY